MIVSGTGKYVRAQFDSEAEIEKVVKDYAKYLFGSAILFIPKSKITTAGGAGTIPDGFVIDIESEEWFIVEVELAAHGTWQHIAPQVSKQITAIDFHATREKLLMAALDVVKTDHAAATVFCEQNIAQLDIHGKLQSILKKPPTIAIPIDRIPADLESWTRTLKFTVKIWEIRKYQSADPAKTVLYSIPDEIVPTMVTGTDAGQPTSTASARWSFQDVMEAGLVSEGQKVLLDYGPRGQPRQTFEGILRKDGVEIDGQVMSLSAAAVYCMHKAGSTRETANGWVMWKTENGTYLIEFYNKLNTAAAEESRGLVQQATPGDS
jgi:Restriction Enzyme Adenine Methylase Associated